MRDHQHGDTLSTAMNLSPTRLFSKSFSLRNSFMLLAALIGDMLALPLRARAGSQLPCILNLTGQSHSDVCPEETMRKQLRALFVAVLLATPVVALPTSVAAQP